ncbi:MAG: hypothetical protein F6K48_25720 [Okeania sp. SIO3H1]|uniref:hypothetical protein n=1 Tax=Okeania sp. SIO1I7 TaxID=2607772 RepID=UPI0013C6ECEF|nr:hypothetical protein [Okeania sp. SIO1I7]NEN92115.1 hypothetical protein [Okeania sp. SIO3H1]NET30258.1 hypothetical protein [Okeania sp. SIO1I7]
MKIISENIETSYVCPSCLSKLEPFKCARNLQRTILRCAERKKYDCQLVASSIEVDGVFWNPKLGEAQPYFLSPLP